ncbi:MAG: hypothetical protein HFF50_04030 [Lawsonibacter sp.]|nr:hypothetical protein [Lawsonibacter sp.]
MNEYPSPVQTPDPSPSPEPPPPSHQPPKTSWMGPATLICSALALILAGAALYFVVSGGQEEPEPPPAPEPPPTFQYRDRTMTVLEGVPVNQYDASEFQLDSTGRVVYEHNGVRAKTGVDVSFYQGEIDWQAVAADGIDFAILRLGYRGYTEGGLILDSHFLDNIRGALDAGLEVGVYFFSQALNPQEAEAEADFVALALEGYAITYPVAFDWEYISNPDARTKNVTGEELTQCAKAFCARIQERGYTPAVYFNRDLAYLSYDLQELTQLPLWLAEYSSRPSFYYDFHLWQYSDTGTVAGIQGNVDLDLDLRPLKP